MFALLKIADNEEGIKQVKKKGFRSTTVRLPKLFIRSTTLFATLSIKLFSSKSAQK